MQLIDLKTTNDRFLISIDRTVIGKEILFDLIEKIRLEYLLQKADFDDGIEELGDEIKGSWWTQNKDRINRFA